MTYRERLLEKVKFDETQPHEAGRDIDGAEWQHFILMPILTALLDECERLSSVLTSIDYGFEPKRPGASLAGGWPIHPNSEVHKDIKRAIAAHATAMEKLCEGER